MSAETLETFPCKLRVFRQRVRKVRKMRSSERFLKRGDETSKSAGTGKMRSAV